MFFKVHSKAVSLPLPFETIERKVEIKQEEQRRRRRRKKVQLKIIGDNQFQTSHIFSIYTVHIKSSFFYSLLSVGQEVNETER